MEAKIGLVMTGGGARGAYQAGVLKRIGELTQSRGGNPFAIMEGASAGAINASALAAGSDDFGPTTELIARLWAALRPSDVYRCGIVSQAVNSLNWIRDLSFGGILGGGKAHSLLDATPLRHYLSRHIDCRRIDVNIRRGHLYALAIAATSYVSGKSYIFVQGKKGHPTWTRSRRVTLPTSINIDHVCASAAIPLIFQPVRIATPEGTGYFGDGCVRLHQPLSPVIRLGADRLVAIGVRGEPEHPQQKGSESGDEPSIAQVMGVVFNAMFLDHLAADSEHLARLNKLLAEGHIRESGNGSDRMRPLASLLITPSVDLSQLAQHHQRDMPYLIQYFVNGLGQDEESCADLMSYLLFTPEYTSALIDIGYQDADRRIDEIESFLFSSADTPKNRMALVS